MPESVLQESTAWTRWSPQASSEQVFKGLSKANLVLLPSKMQSPKEKEEPLTIYVVLWWLKPLAQEKQDKFSVCLCLGGSNLHFPIAMGVPQPQDCRWRWVEKAFLHSLVKLWDCAGKTKRFPWPFMRRKRCWGSGAFPLFFPIWCLFI